ncbi:MAG TPA: type III pantothenate kinase [Gammaproteobacteria bacterium]|nr:type III pantothenate kinase [Gammaproteobacteria bacterium]
MILLLDAGNTSVKWGLYEAGDIVTSGSFMHRGSNLDALADQSWSELQMPAGVYIANVAGEDTGQQLSGWITKQWGITPVFISTTGQACGVTNAYAVPEQLGVDRWAALIGAHFHHSGALCIVDCGTAITLDMLAADGLHQGGLILPGVEMMKHMLLKNTAVKSTSCTQEPANLFATGTEDAINSGALYMAVAAIDRMVADMAATPGAHTDVVLTGGDASRILTLLACPARHDPELVLKGLAILAGGR